jgi:hypothetical protein
MEMQRQFARCAELCEIFNIDLSSVRDHSGFAQSNVFEKDQVACLLRPTNSTAWCVTRRGVKSGRLPSQLATPFARLSRLQQTRQPRRLVPMMEYGTATLEIRGAWPFTVEATTYQMLLLCALETCDASTTRQLEDRTGLYEADFENDLRLLSGFGLVVAKNDGFLLNAVYEPPVGSRHVVLPRTWHPAPLTRQDHAQLKSQTEHGIIRLLCAYRQMKRRQLRAEVHVLLPSPLRTCPQVFGRVFDEQLSSLVAREYVCIETDQQGEEVCHRVF